jgi:phage tail-like protein
MTGAQFGAARASDPYRGYPFVVRWDGRAVAGFARVTALARATAAVTPQRPKLPGGRAFEPITLQRGVTHDDAFTQWCNQVWQYSSSTSLAAQASLDDFRRDVVIELRDEAGQPAQAYAIHRCWASQLTALPELDANGGALAIEALVLQHEGCEPLDGR